MLISTVKGCEWKKILLMTRTFLIIINSFETQDLKLFCSRLLCSDVSIWLRALLISRARAPGSFFIFILRLLLMSLLSAPMFCRDRCFVLALRNKSTKFTRFTSPALLILSPDWSKLNESSWILFVSALLGLGSLSTVFLLMNSSGLASSFGSSTNSIS